MVTSTSLEVTLCLPLFTTLESQWNMLRKWTNWESALSRWESFSNGCDGAKYSRKHLYNLTTLKWLRWHRSFFSFCFSPSKNMIYHEKTRCVKYFSNLTEFGDGTRCSNHELFNYKGAFKLRWTLLNTFERLTIVLENKKRWAIKLKMTLSTEILVRSVMEKRTFIGMFS